MTEAEQVHALLPKLKGRYDDDRHVQIMSAANYEVTIQIGNQEPMFVDAIDFLRLVSHVVLDLVYGPAEERSDG